MVLTSGIGGSAPVSPAWRMFVGMSAESNEGWCGALSGRVSSLSVSISNSEEVSSQGVPGPWAGCWGLGGEAARGGDGVGVGPQGGDRAGGGMGSGSGREGAGSGVGALGREGTGSGVGVMGRGGRCTAAPRFCTSAAD